MAGTLCIDTLQSGAGDTVPANTLIRGPAKAWVNFNGIGTVAIREAFNVSSITDVGVGGWWVNFTTPMPRTTYAAIATNERFMSGAVTYETGRVSIIGRNATDAQFDPGLICVAVFSNP